MESQGQRVRHECVVHKANVPLAAGESLNAYTQKLSSDGRAYVMKQLNLNSLAKPASAGAYLIEAYSDKCIFDVYKYGGDGGSSEYKYYAFSYTRKADGKFEFKDLAEVERVVSFQAKQSLSVSKGKAKKDFGEDDEEEMEETEPEELANKPSKKKTAKATEFAPGWAVKKHTNIWEGLI